MRSSLKTDPVVSGWWLRPLTAWNVDASHVPQCDGSLFYDHKNDPFPAAHFIQTTETVIYWPFRTKANLSRLAS